MWGRVAQKLDDHIQQCIRDKEELKRQQERNHVENTTRLDGLVKSVDRLLTLADENAGIERYRTEQRHAKTAQWMIFATIAAAVVALYADKIFKFMEPR